MKPGDRLICLFVSDYLVGDTFKEWPLHITVVPWFRIKEAEKFNKELSTGLSKISPIKLAVGEERFFGRNKKLVNLVKPNKKLSSLEKISRELLKSYNAWIVDESTKIKRAFSPHISVQRNERMSMGDKLSINKVYIIEQNGENKQVVYTVDLNGKI